MNIEQILQNIIDAYYSNQGNPLDRAKILEKAIDKGRFYLDKLYGCKFQSENGIGCHEKAVRISFGVPCCERHAVIRGNEY